MNGYSYGTIILKIYWKEKGMQQKLSKFYIELLAEWELCLMSKMKKIVKCKTHGECHDKASKI